MVKEIVKSILDAEKIANEMISKATAEGVQIELDANVKAEGIAEDGAKQLRELAAANKKKATELSEQSANAFIKEQSQKDGVFFDVASKRMDKAVSIILESVK